MRQRKVRLFRCDKCHVCYSRLKHDLPRHCSKCGKIMVMAHCWPPRAFWVKRNKAAKKEYDNRDKREQELSRLVDSKGYAIRLDRDIRKAWKSLRRSRRINAFTSRGQVFIDTLYKNGIHRGCINGMTDAPKLEIVKVIGDSQNTLGIYQRAFMRGMYRIQIQRRNSITEMLSTLLHEIIHVAEDSAHTKKLHKIDYPDHGRTFDNRLKKLKKLLRFGDIA